MTLTENISKSPRPVGEWFGIVLVKPKIIENYGQICRLAVNYNAKILIVIQPQFKIKRHKTDTYNAIKHLPILITNDFPQILNVPYIYVDFSENSIPLYEFEHPKRALYVFGGEDQTLITPKNRRTVYIPTTGCLNLAMAVNTILYDRNYKLYINKKG